MDAHLVEILGAWVALVGGAGALLVTIYRHGRSICAWLKPKIMFNSRITRIEQEVSSISAILPKLVATVDEIKAEVQTNGAGHTLRRQLEREHEARWLDYEITGRAVWETGKLPNGEFGCVRATAALHNMVGQNPLGIGWLNAIHPHDRPKIEDTWNHAVEFGTTYDQKQRFCHFDNHGRIKSITYARARFVPRFDDAGQFAGGFGQCFEITKEEYDEL